MCALTGLDRSRSRQQGAVLIVVVGLLAVLSLMAVTFHTIMRMESTAVRNREAVGLARRAALAGVEHVRLKIQDDPSACDRREDRWDPHYTTAEPRLCPHPTHELYCQQVLVTPLHDVGFVVDYDAADTSHRSKFPRAGVQDLSGRFNINTMGWAADLGSDRDERLRVSSVQASLVRLILAKISEVDSGWDANTRRWKAIRIARAIVEHRLGPDKRPGQKNYNDCDAEQRLGWHAYGDWNVDHHDDGVNDQSGPLAFGKDDGYPSILFFDPTHLPGTAGYQPYYYAEREPWSGGNYHGTWLGRDISGWRDDKGVDWPVSGSTDSQKNIGLHDGMPSAIRGPDGVIHMEYGVRQVAQDIDEPYEIGRPNPMLAVAKVSDVANPTPDTTLIADTSANCQYKVDWTVNEWIGRYVKIVERDNSGDTYGKYAVGQMRRIAGNTSDTLTIGTAWTANPDKKCVFAIYGRGSDPLASGNVSNAGANTLDVVGATWTADQWRDYHVTIVRGTGVGQTRRIEFNTVNGLTLYSDWVIVPNNSSRFEIYAISDDQPYASPQEIVGVVKEELESHSDETESEAEDKAERLYHALRDYITTDSYENMADHVSINDWSKDRIDNDGDGLVDEDSEWQGRFTDTEAAALKTAIRAAHPGDPQLVVETFVEHCVYLHALRKGLGLDPDDPDSPVSTTDTPSGDKTIARTDANRIIANIVDFRDDDDVPTMFYDTDAAYDAYGAEGLHITEFMPGVAWEVSTTNGAECVDDGGGGTIIDGFDWDWMGGYPPPDQGDYWKKLDNPPREAHWQFTGLKAGWYAIKLKGQNGQGPYRVRFNADPNQYNVTFTSGEAYIRDVGSPSRLVAVEVAAATQTLDIYIRAGRDAQFEGFQFLPQFIEITNMAMRAPTRAISHAVNLSDDGGWELDVGVGGTTNTISLDREVQHWDGSATRTDRLIPAARGDGRFPVDYGFYVIAMCEKAYARQYGGADETWGNEPGEEYPVLFIGDVASETDKLAFPNPIDSATELTITLKDGNGNVVAGGAIDGLDPAISDASFQEYVSKEKANPLGVNWYDLTTTVPTTLADSQNRQVEVMKGSLAGVPPYVLDVTIRTCLNRLYGNVTETPWLSDLYPLSGTWRFKAMEEMSELSVAPPRTPVAFPIILNRPYHSPGWLGLVPSTRAFRTIDPDPDPGKDFGDPTRTETPFDTRHLLGRLCERATVGGIYARVNINTADIDPKDGSTDTDYPVLSALFGKETAQKLGALRSARPAKGWTELDELFQDLADLNFEPRYHQKYQCADCGWVVYAGAWPNNCPECAGTDMKRAEDSGACTYMDDFPNDWDEREEWYRRFADLITLRSNVFRVESVGVVYPKGETAPLAEARVEAIIQAEDTDGDGQRDKVRVRRWRYLAED